MVAGSTSGEVRLRPMRAITAVAIGAVFILVAVLSNPPSSGAVGTAPALGTARAFAVLAATTVTNTGPSVIGGDLGVSPGSAVVGFPPGTVNGVIHAGDAVAAQAQSDALAAYNALAGQPCDFDLTGQDLGGMTLIPGVYCFSSSAQLTGALTLDAQGDPDAVFIFQIGTTLTTASNSSVNLVNEASPCNVFWQIGTSATFGTTTRFVGTVLASESITATTGTDVVGRLVALNGAVTLDTNDVGIPPCDGITTTTSAPGTTTTTLAPGTTTTTLAPGTTTTTLAPGTTTTTTLAPGTTTTTLAPGTTTTTLAPGTTTTTLAPGTTTSTLAPGGTSTSAPTTPSTSVGNGGGTGGGGGGAPGPGGGPNSTAGGTAGDTGGGARSGAPGGARTASELPITGPQSAWLALLGVLLLGGGAAALQLSASQARSSRTDH